MKRSVIFCLVSVLLLTAGVVSAKTLFNKAGFKVVQSGADIVTVTSGNSSINIVLTGGYLDLGQDKGFIFRDTIFDQEKKAVENSENIQYRYRRAKINNGKLEILISGNQPEGKYKTINFNKHLYFSKDLADVIEHFVFRSTAKDKKEKAADAKRQFSISSCSEYKADAFFEFSDEKPIDLTQKKNEKATFLPLGTQYIIIGKKFTCGLKFGDLVNFELTNNGSAKIVTTTKQFNMTSGVRLYSGSYYPEKALPVYKDFTLEHGYDLKDKLVRRASLHMHAQYHPGYKHAPVRPADRLVEYRDVEVTPRYGFAALTEHNRIILPDTCEPLGKQPQWGVEGIVFVPGMERSFGNPYAFSQRDRMLGELNMVGASRERLKPFVGKAFDAVNQRSLKHNRWPTACLPEQLMAEAVNEGIFVSLCHPECRKTPTGYHHWKRSGYTWDEMDLIYGNPNKGMAGFPVKPHALEIGNQGYDFSARTLFINAEKKWDFYLTRGCRINGTASDDAHGRGAKAGWVVVYVDKLDQESLLKALRSGNYYSSQGPEIKNIEISNKTMTVESVRPGKIEFIGAGGKVLAAFDNAVKGSYTAKGNEVYLRARVTHDCPEMRDIKFNNIHHRRSAWSNPVYLKGK